MKVKAKKVLITGGVGFIGYHLATRLLAEGHSVIGIDNLNEYYDINLKLDRLNLLRSHKCFEFQAICITNKSAFDDLFKKHTFDLVINLAAQAGVRYSIEKPYKYIDSNLIGFINVLEACRNNGIKNLIYASSSSVYGANKTIPFSEEHQTDAPVSLYAATKKANELMAHSYSSLYSINCFGLRFFTVYGPWGRPDMAYYKFAKAMMQGHQIDIYNKGQMKRDFTYIDDIIESIHRLILRIFSCNHPLFLNPIPIKDITGHQIFNIGNNNPIELMTFINTLEKHLEITANKKFIGMQPGDVLETYANIDKLSKIIEYSPKFNIEKGISAFCKWFKAYNQRTKTSRLL